MVRLASWIDGLNEFLGRTVAWLALVMVVLQFGLVLLRYVFGFTDRASEEAVLYLHGILFLLAAGYTLKHHGHVRVDLFYRDAPEKTQALINLIGTIVFLLPVCALTWSAAWPFVESAWAVREGSIEASGLPFRYVYKSVILVFAAVVALQGLAQAIKSWCVLRGYGSVPEPDQPAL